jgi:tetratricopeptide (TPR) repeat protein
MNVFETAVALHRQGRLAEAEQHYRAALAAFPGQPEVLYGIGLTCLQTGQTEEAVYRFEQVLAASPDHGGALMSLGEALLTMGRQVESVAAFRRLIAKTPDNAEAHHALGQALKQVGDFAPSREAFARAVALAPANVHYHYALAESARFTTGDPRLPALEDFARNESQLAPPARAELHFALFKAYDALKRHDEAFTHLEQGNRIYRSLVPYDEAEVSKLFAELKETYSVEAIAAHSGAGHPSEVPIFVVGMPRSGTSLVEQILASHPDVHGAGELLFVQDLILGGFAGYDYPIDLAQLGEEGLRRFGGYYAVRLAALAPNAKRIVDKLPANFRHLGFLHLALPQARIIQMHRNARDTCFSCYTQLFANGLNYAYDLGELGRYHRAASDLMAHWRAVLPPSSLLEIRYEDLVGDFEAEVRRLIAFCGLPWDDAVLRFHETKRAVRTNSEYQVRQPLYTSSIGRWRAYESKLGPLFAALE